MKVNGLGLGIGFTVFTGAILLMSACANVSGRAGAGGAGDVAGGGSAGGELSRLHEAFHEYFTYEPLQVPDGAAVYRLPLEKKQVAEFDRWSARLMLAPEARDLLLRNGFVVTGFPFDRTSEQFDEAYMVLKHNDIPVFVTSASLLHAFHVIFDNTLQIIEARDLYDRVWNMGLTLFNGCWDTYRASDGDLKEAARRDAVFLAVGLSMMRPRPGGDYLEVGIDRRSERDASGNLRIVEEVRLPDGLAGTDLEREFTSLDRSKYTFDVPDEIESEVNRELGLIDRHSGFTPSPVFKYTEDYSQYVPRGHYTVSDKLENYFKAMMWFGRMSMLLKGSEDIEPGATCATCDALISEYDSRIQTVGACLLGSLMAGTPSLLESWGKVYEVTSFFVGFSDDLGPYEYIDAMNAVMGGTDAVPQIDQKAYGELKAKLAEYRAPMIYGGTGACEVTPPFTPEQADECLQNTRGFRFMGQRFVPDSYVFSKLVAPYVREFKGRKMPFTAYDIPGIGIGRVFPRGLDLLAVMGSDRALDLLHDLGDADYEDYDKMFRQMYDELDAIEDDEWNQNLYWNWLWVLKALVAQYGKTYPAFMHTQAWQDKLVTTALASWTELRHDTILYAKQSYTMALTGAPPPPETRNGGVEPVPEVYNRLLSLTRMMRLGLEDMGMLDPAEMSSRNMDRLERILERLISISIKELAGGPLDRNDKVFIADFGDNLKDVLDGVERNSRKATLVADVHTDANSGMVLEEACGYVELIVVAWKDENGIWLAAGPEMSYYEFKQPMANRLTNEAWRKILELQKPDPPVWTSSYRR